MFIYLPGKIVPSTSCLTKTCSMLQEEPEPSTCDTMMTSQCPCRTLTVSSADDLHNGRREEPNSIHSSLRIVDVSFPPAVNVLLQHLQGASQVTVGHCMSIQVVYGSLQVTMSDCRSLWVTTAGHRGSPLQVSMGLY